MRSFVTSLITGVLGYSIFLGVAKGVVTISDVIDAHKIAA